MDVISAHIIEEPPPETSLHVASLIAHVRQQYIADVAHWLDQQPRVEVHAQSAEGKFAVVMECDHERAVLELLDTLGQLPGVLNTALIYHEIITAEEDV